MLAARTERAPSCPGPHDEQAEVLGVDQTSAEMLSQAAIAEFQALKAEMEKVQRLGLERVGLATARRLASRFNAALAAVPESGQLDAALPQQVHRAHSKEWDQLSQQERQAAMLLGTCISPRQALAEL